MFDQHADWPFWHVLYTIYAILRYTHTTLCSFDICLFPILSFDKSALFFDGIGSWFACKYENLLFYYTTNNQTNSQQTLSSLPVPAKSVPDMMFLRWIPALPDVRTVLRSERNVLHTLSTRRSVSWPFQRITSSVLSLPPILEHTKWPCGTCWEHEMSIFSTGNHSERDGSVMPFPT